MKCAIFEEHSSSCVVYSRFSGTLFPVSMIDGETLKYRQINMLLALSLSDVLFILLINVKMPTIFGILPFMSRINFVLS